MNLILETGLTEQRRTFGYDPDSNMTSVKTYAGGSVSVNVSEITATSTSAGELDTLHETIFGPATDVNGETVSSSFDWAQDGLLEKRTTDGKISEYDHQLNGLELTATPFGGLGSLTNTWLPNGSLAKVELPNGSTIDHTFDDADRTTNRIVKNSSGTKLSSWESIGWDDNDNRTGETVTQRQVDGSNPAPGTAGYGYDTLDRLVSAKHPFESATALYALDDAGNITTETGNPAGTGEFTYSFTDNRLITRTPTDPPGAVSGYAYDHFGNQTTETKGSEVTTNTYDAASQPAQTSGPEGTVDYGYDGLGRMVWRISDTPTPDSKTLFFHDGLGQQITVETDEDGDRQTRYLLDSSGSPLGQEQIQGTTLRRSYFVTDPRGNLTQLLSQAEQIRAVFAYDPFGKPKEDLTEVTANWDSRLRFQMAPKDAATGNYNLGARLLNPDINRFIGADNYVGAAANVALQVDPLTGNRYMYAGANPAGMIDDGHRSFLADPRCPWTANSACKPRRKLSTISNESTTSASTKAECIATPSVGMKRRHQLIQEGKFCTPQGRFYKPLTSTARETNRSILEPATELTGTVAVVSHGTTIVTGGLSSPVTYLRGLLHLV